MSFNFMAAATILSDLEPKKITGVVENKTGKMDGE